MLSAGLTIWKRAFKNRFVHLFQRESFVPSSLAVDTRKYLQLMQYQPTDSINQEDEKSYNQIHREGASSGSLAKHLACLPDEPSMSSPTSLAKSLACLPDETSMPVKRKDWKRMELKRSIETRIKKRVKEQYLNGKFCDLIEKVIANANTLQDSYDVIRLNSNVGLTTEGDGLCFVTLAEQLASGNFDVKANTMPIFCKNKSRECLILPNVKLKVLQEAMRIVLEVVYRPHFSKISHGCRSGRGHHSALRYICHEIHNPDWWFTLRMSKKADNNILSKLLLAMEEKIIDSQLFSFIHCMFDANVLNLEFGGFPKGHGLPQEGILSPILMNIYLDILDHEVFRIFMRYEGLGMNSDSPKGGQQSKLRQWIRRQRKSNNGNKNEQVEASGLRLHCCRCMDEIFIAVSGSKEIALSLKFEIENYLKNSLYLQLEDRTSILAVGSSFHELQFLGTAVRATSRANEAVRAVHKLKDKVKSFASQKQELWDDLTVRIGKKWLAHGLKRIKESEIKQLGLSSPILDQISHFRKEGMKTDHWFKSLIKIWLQDVNAKFEDNEQVVLSKYIAEPAVPKDLTDSFYNFQKLVEEYISYETAATLDLLSNSSQAKGSTPSPIVTKIKMEAPISYIRKCLMRYGLINTEGFPRRISSLLLQDDILIVHWFSGLVCRWLKWYSEFDNFQEIKLMIVEHVRKSCIRTLAVKHRMHESVIEKRFELELNGIPLSEELESDWRAMTSDPLFTNDDESMYGIFHSGLCMLSLARVKVPSRPLNCFVVGCSCGSPSMYTLHVKERQKFPGWKTGFSTAIHPSLNGKRIALCTQHVKDLYLGNISLQSIDFCSLRR